MSILQELIWYWILLMFCFGIEKIDAANARFYCRNCFWVFEILPTTVLQRSSTRRSTNCWLRRGRTCKIRQQVTSRVVWSGLGAVAALGSRSSSVLKLFQAQQIWLATKLKSFVNNIFCKVHNYFFSSTFLWFSVRSCQCWMSSSQILGRRQV